MNRHVSNTVVLHTQQQHIREKSGDIKYTTVTHRAQGRGRRVHLLMLPPIKPSKSAFPEERENIVIK